MQPIQIITIIFALFALSRVILRSKEKKLTSNQFIIWIFIWISLVIFASFPSLLTQFAQISGIGRGIDILVYGGIILLFYFLFKLYIKIKGIDEKITKLTRVIAIENEYKTRKNNR